LLTLDTLWRSLTSGNLDVEAGLQLSPETW